MTSLARTHDPVKSRSCCWLRRNTTAPGVTPARGFAALSLVAFFFATLSPVAFFFAVLSLVAFFFAALFATLEPL